MTDKRSFRLLAAAMACLVWSSVFPAAAAPAAPAGSPATAAKLDDASCQACHDGSKGEVTITDAAGK